MKPTFFLRASSGILLAVVFLALSRFLFLSRTELQDWDEALFAWRAKVCVWEGAWLDQHHHSIGDPDLPEGGFYSGAFPPLYVWVTALLYKVFGFSEWASRLGSAAAGAGCVVALFMIGRRLSGHLCGLLAALFLSSIPYFCRYSRLGQTDVPYIFFVLCVVALSIEAQRSGRRACWVGAGAALGLGLMTKIAVALMAPAALGLFGLYRIATGNLRWRALFEEQAIILGVGLAVAAPWHIAMSVSAGRIFWWWTLAFHLFGKAAQTQDLNQGGPLFYVGEIAMRVPGALGLIAVCAAVAGLVAMARSLRRSTESPRRDPFENHPANPYGLPLLWLGMLLAGFSASATKRSTYTLPMFPPLCLLAAVGVARMAASPMTQRFVERVAAGWPRWPARARRPVAAALAFAIAGAACWNGGLRPCFKPADPRDDWGWSALSERLDRRDYDRIIAIGPFKTPRSVYYLNGANLGWVEGIEFAPVAIRGDEPGTVEIEIADEAAWGALEKRLTAIMRNGAPAGRGSPPTLLIASAPAMSADEERFEQTIARATGLALQVRSRRLLLFAPPADRRP